MADKFDRLSDGSPRDPSNMGGNSHTSLYIGVLIAALVVGVGLYWSGLV